MMKKLRLALFFGIVFQGSVLAQGFIENLQIKLDTTLLNAPSALYVEDNSDVLVVDAYNNAIRRLKWDGTAETVVKTGNSLATDLVGIVDLTKDADGNIYVIDAPKGNIKKITPAGIITAITGTGSSNTSVVIQQPSGIVYDKTSNTLVVAINWAHKVCRVALDGTILKTFGNGLQGYVDGNISVAQFKYPKDVAVDAAGNVYVSEQGTHSIRLISPSDVVSTWAGSNAQGYVNDTRLAAKFNNPDRLAFNAHGDLFVSELGSNRVRKIHKDRDTVTTFASDNPSADGASVTISGSLAGMAFLDANDFIYTYQSQHAVYIAAFTYYNSYMDEKAYFGQGDKPGYKNGFASNANLGFYSVAVDSKGNIFLAPYGSNIYKIDTDGKFTNFSGSIYKDGYAEGKANESRYFSINSLAVDKDDNLLIAEDYYADVRRIDNKGTNVRIAGQGLPPAQTTGDIYGDGFATSQRLFFPRTPIADAAGEVLVADAAKLRKIKSDGNFEAISAKPGEHTYNGIGPAQQTLVKAVQEMALLPNGKVFMIHASRSYVTGYDGAAYQILSDSVAGYRDGKLDTARFTSPWDIAVDKSGNVYIYDNGLDNIRMIDKNGQVSTIIDFSLSDLRRANTRTEDVTPISIAYHPAGYLITSNFANGNLARINLENVVTSIADNTQAAISVNAYPNPNEGSFYIDSKEPVQKVEVFTTGGQTETFYGREIKTSLKGLLLVRVTTATGVSVSKVLVK